MADAYVNDRLFSPLRVRAGRRQFVVTGEILDDFLVDSVHGARSLEDALRIYAVREGFEVAVFLDAEIKPRFLKPEMGRVLDEVARRPDQSRSDGPTGGACCRTSGHAVLDQLTRLLSSEHKSLVVFMHPERMWIGPITPPELAKLETVVGWCRHHVGHPNSLSILVVNPNRLAEFSALADHWGKRSSFTSVVQIGKPDRRELECFLRRIVCRYGLSGDVQQLAEVAFAQQMSIYNVGAKIVEFLREQTAATALDGLLGDASQVKTLQQLQAELDQLIGLGEIKKLVRELVAVAQDEAERRRLGQNVEPRSYHMFFLGNPGTGKTVVARLIGQIFWAMGLRSSCAFVEISPGDIISPWNPGDTIKKIKDAVARAMGGVLFIDEVYGLAEDSWGRQALEALMKEMEDHREQLTVIMAGYEEKLPELFKVNPGFKSRVNYTLRFPDYGTGELVQMFMVQVEKAALTLSPAAHEKVTRYIASFNRMGGIGNGRGVRNLFEHATKALSTSRSGTNEIQVEMIPDPICFREAEAQAVLDQIDREFLGLQRAKGFLRDLFLRQRSKHTRGDVGEGAFNHCVFLGNPGTGKTSLARHMGRLFYFMGLVSERDRFVEVDPIHDLTSKYQCEYAEKVRDCFDRASGGVLFIDEAYQLANSDQGKAVIDQIVKLTTEARYRNLAVILAGYTDPMQQLYKANPGLKRRFPHTVYFDDFSPAELAEIFHSCMKRDSRSVADDERDAFEVRLRAELQRMSRQRHFGNAGAVENFYEKVKANQDQRLRENPGDDAFQLRLTDLSREDEHLEDIEDILREMDRDFVGLQAVKEQITRLARRIRFDRMREAHRRGGGRPEATRLYNMRFVGSPGTGKTTIARYMARVFYSLGITFQPRVRELRGVDLKGTYVGWTKDKVNELFETSAGQVLLIDEIYGVQNQETTDRDSFGQEAIDTLVGCITDTRNESTVIILAGYKPQMDGFLAANAGLASRFPNEIEFPDYSVDECAEILYRRLDREGYTWPQDDADFRQAVLGLFAELKFNRDFGNARTVGHVFDQIIEELDQRVAGLDQPTAQDLLCVKREDLARVLARHGLVTSRK